MGDPKGESCWLCSTDADFWAAAQAALLNRLENNPPRARTVTISGVEKLVINDVDNNIYFDSNLGKTMKFT